MFNSLSQFGITKRAFNNKICELFLVNPRDFTTDPYHRIDDKPYGGGSGMIMKAKPLELAINKAIQQQEVLGVKKSLKIFLSPQGKPVNQDIINNLSEQKGIVFVCGRYEGVDERFIEQNIDMEISVGDIVVSGGELPAMLIIDAIMRQLPGVLNDEESALTDSFMNGLLDYPHYTTPRDYNGSGIPDVLLSGNHKQINKWRLQQSLWRTYKRRPELLQKRTLTKIESGLLEEMINKSKKIINK